MVVSVLALFIVVTGVVMPMLAMLTGCFVGPLQSALFLSPLLPLRSPRESSLRSPL